MDIIFTLLRQRFLSHVVFLRPCVNAEAVSPLSFDFILYVGPATKKGIITKLQLAVSARGERGIDKK